MFGGMGILLCSLRAYCPTNAEASISCSLNKREYNKKGPAWGEQVHVDIRNLNLRAQSYMLVSAIVAIGNDEDPLLTTRSEYGRYIPMFNHERCKKQVE